MKSFVFVCFIGLVREEEAICVYNRVELQTRMSKVESDGGLHPTKDDDKREN
jgi:hypothetical protein